MSERRKLVITGKKGCDLCISSYSSEAENTTSYISIGPDGKDVSIRCDGIVYYFNSFEDMFKAIQSNAASQISVDEDKIRYFELELARGTPKNFHPEGRLFCIKAIREPSLEEATEYAKQILKVFNCDLVTKVEEISKKEAYEKYNVWENKKIFGLNIVCHEKLIS